MIVDKFEHARVSKEVSMSDTGVGVSNMGMALSKYPRYIGFPELY